MSAPFHALEALEAAVGAIARATTPSEIFRALLEGSPCGAPRAAVFLLRDRRFKGWGTTGHGPAPSRALRSYTAPEHEGWLARVAATEEPWLPAGPEDDLPRFGQAPADDTLGVPVRVGGKTVAAVVAERGMGEGPWHPEALAVLVHAARLRLELDLAWRRLRGVGTARADVSPAIEPASEVDARPADAGASPVAGTSQIAPWSEPQSPPSGPTHQDDDARRYARLVATDIRLYNEEAVVQGRRQGDLARRLGDQLQRGREAFERRFPEMGNHGLEILRDSYVQVLAGGDPSLIPGD